ncbi:hypothetical protein TcBrA4_0136560 [Trypanosoma cruzi]|nr:hypothetical protein TcBrA4_0136560 [Trypanosoma cruzi]
MLRFIFERLYQHTSETALTFVKEIGLGSEEDACLEAVAALHDAIKAKMFAPNARMSDAKERNKHAGEGGEKLRGARQKCCIFAVSSHYEWGAKQEILEALTHKLHHTTVVLQRCEASKEPSMALQLGCNVLISPFMPTNLAPLLMQRRKRCCSTLVPALKTRLTTNWMRCFMHSTTPHAPVLH